MNTLQTIAILAYLVTLFFCLFFYTKRFEKGWLQKMVKGKYNVSNGYIDFRVISIIVVVSFVLLLKWIGV
jgi:hypothetical protein